MVRCELLRCEYTTRRKIGQANCGVAAGNDGAFSAFERNRRGAGAVAALPSLIGLLPSECRHREPIALLPLD